MARPAKGKSAPPPDPVASMRIVVLHGADSLRKRDWTGRFIDVMTEAFGEIQRFDFDGATIEPAVILDELRSYGLLQQHKLVVLENADQFLVLKEDEDSVPAGGRRRTARQLMEAYAASPVEDATLLMKADSWRKSKLTELVMKVGAVVRFDPPKDSEAVDWVVGEGAQRHDVKINRNAAQLLVERLGSGLDRLDMELAKLASFVGPGKTVKRELVVDMVGMSREEEAWILQEAMATGDADAALSKLRELMDVSRHNEVPLMWGVIDLTRKLYASSKLMRQGMDDYTVAQQIGLWGESRGPILRAAKKIDSHQLAQLLRNAVMTDKKNKSGMANPRRSLEVLTMHIADTIGSN